jgi:hypothetical protein
MFVRTWALLWAAAWRWFFSTASRRTSCPRRSYRAEFAQFRRRQRPDGGRHEFGAVGKDRGVDGVGRGELAQALGAIADLPGVGDDGREPLGQQRAAEQLLIGPGRFADQAFGGIWADPGEESGAAVLGVVEAALAVGGSAVDVQVAWGNVDAEESARPGSLRKGKRCRDPATRAQDDPVPAG